MNRDKAKEYQRQCQEYRKSLYNEYPETERFEKRKKRFGIFLLGYYAILYLVKSFAMGYSGYHIFTGLITVFWIQMIFIVVAMGSKWKMACSLYILVSWQLATYLQSFSDAGLTSWEQFRFLYIDSFSQYPLSISLDYLSWLLMLMILLFAIWLTLVPANRRMADQSEAINQQMKEYMDSHPMQ